MALSKYLDLRNFFRKVTVDGRKEIDPVFKNIFQHDWETTNRLVRIPSRFRHRPDLIADELLEENGFYWIVLLANDIIDPFDGIVDKDRLKLDVDSNTTILIDDSSSTLTDLKDEEGEDIVFAYDENENLLQTIGVRSDVTSTQLVDGELILVNDVGNKVKIDKIVPAEISMPRPSEIFDTLENYRRTSLT